METIVSSMLLSVYFMETAAHNLTCIIGGGDSRGSDDVVDTGTEMIDEDLVTLYLGYNV